MQCAAAGLQRKAYLQKQRIIASYLQSGAVAEYHELSECVR